MAHPVVGDRANPEYYIKITITKDEDSSELEKKYLNTMLVKDLKMRLELLLGIRSDYMLIDLFVNEVKDKLLNDDNLQIGQVMPGDGLSNQLRIHVSERKDKVKIDEEEVEKFTLSEEKYSLRDNSARRYMMENKLGPYAEKKNLPLSDIHNSTSLIKAMNIGDKVEVESKEGTLRKGVIRFIGDTQFKSGLWIGVEFDDSVGKNDGSVDGVRYFECSTNCGVFVRPNKVKVIN